MTLFNNKYRIESARYKSWDYRWIGAYFITICTDHYKNHYFGRIVDDKMQLSNVGVIADLLWYEIKNREKYIKLGEFVVMPNHMHGILIICDEKNLGDSGETLHATSVWDHWENMENMENGKNVGNGKNNKNSQFMSKISPKSHSISTIIRSYKSAVTRHANRLNLTMKWQVKFHDHIIRDKGEFNRISNYIIKNPANWDEDKFCK